MLELHILEHRFIFSIKSVTRFRALASNGKESS
jgi:hypothetical protein